MTGEQRMRLNFERLHQAAQGPLGGLAWSGSAMLFADVAGNTILAFEPQAATVGVWRPFSNRANGIAFGPDGALFACQEGGRRVVRLLADGSAVPTACMLDGRVQNHPRAIAVDAHGDAWFSDRHHALPASGPQIFPLQDHQSVLRLARDARVDAGAEPACWQLERMSFDAAAPRGLAFSPDGRTLYVAEGDEASQLRAYPVSIEGRLGPATVLHRSAVTIDGLCCDADGRVLACVAAQGPHGSGAIQVFGADGALLQNHPLPVAQPVQCAFGDAHLDSLYVTTACGALLRARDTGYRGLR